MILKDDSLKDRLPNPIQVEIDNMNSLISKNAMELLKTFLQKQKAPPPKKNPKTAGSVDFTGELYHIFKLEIILILHKLFQKIEKMGEYFHLILRS